MWKNRYFNKTKIEHYEIIEKNNRIIPNGNFSTGNHFFRL